MRRLVLCAAIGCKDLRRTYDRWCPTHRNEVNRRWREANPEKMRASRARYRASIGMVPRVKAEPETFDPAEHEHIMANGECVVCS